MQCSRFFERCLSSGMKEAENNIVELPEDNCMALDLFAVYMYKDNFLEAWLHSDNDVLGALHAWVFGDKSLRA